MAYVPITEIVLKTDFEARDVTIINYNASLERIKTYLEIVVGNVEYINTAAQDANIPVTAEEEPADYSGNVYFRIEE